MIIDINEITKIVDYNNIKEVYDPIYLNMDMMPTAGGVFSYEIFGKSPYDRKNTFAYINLGKKYMQPVIYTMLKVMKRNIVKCLDSTGKFNIIDGEMVKDPNGISGVDFVYKNWNKLRFEYGENPSPVKKTKVDLINKMTRDEIFTDKWLVIPPFYRDLNMSDVASGKLFIDDLNKYYIKLINLTRNNINNATMDLDFVSNKVDALINAQLLIIYQYFQGKLAKKKGIIKDKLLKKVIDYSSRGILSVASKTHNKPTDVPVTYDTTGLPLPHVISLYFPILVSLIHDVIHAYIKSHVHKMYVLNSKNELVSRDISNDEIINIENNYTHDKIELVLKKLIRDHDFRLSYIEFKYNKKDVAYLAYDFKNDILPEESLVNVQGKPIRLTWLELLSKVAHANLLPGKMIVLTRYPMEHFHNILFSRVRMLTVDNITNFAGCLTFPILVREKDGTINKHNVQHMDTIQVASAYLKDIGGDFDGDSVSVRSLYSKEANIEAEQLMKKKIGMLNVDGSGARHVINEGVLGLYLLTKRQPKK